MKRRKIDLAPLGIEQGRDNCPYYCTPENADIIGWAGVDGIHYCTVPQFGETVFAVSPMNFGDCVHPIARNFEDLLRLLLSCTDMAALEQCFAWDEEQFKAFLADNPATDKQRAALESIRREYDLQPIENAFAYVKKLQAEFDLSKIPYTDDYYDIDMNPAAPERDEPWQVFFDGDWFGKRKPSDRPGEEVPLNTRFFWNDEIWHIPSVYVFPNGIVADFCVEIDPERERAFLEKCELPKIRQDRPTREVRNQIDNENPLNVAFRPHFTVNGDALRLKCSTASSWIPTGFLPNGVQNDREAARIIGHYGLDETKAWSFHRTASLWAAKRPTIKSMSLKLEREASKIYGIRFENPSVGDVITFTHPVFGTEHKLTVSEYEPQELPSVAFAHPEYEFPRHHIAMTYTLEPDIPDKNFRVKDCLNSDEPKRRPKTGYEPQGTYDVGAIGIIGGAEGPTAMILSAKSGDKASPHAALSALHFEKQSDITWMTVFTEKLTDDIEIALL